MNGKGAQRHRILFATVCLLYIAGSFFVFCPVSYASGNTSSDEAAIVIGHVEELKAALEKDDPERAKQVFGTVKKWWTVNKKLVKQTSLQMSLEIDSQIAGISLALLNKENEQALELVGTLQFSLNNYRDGAYIDNEGNQRMTLGTYIMKLRQTGDLIQQQKWNEAQGELKQLQQQWLSVEGDIVSKSQTVYNHAERDLVLLDAYLSNTDQHLLAMPVMERLIASLTPLSDAQYSWWDAALIPLREGLEAMLVVGSLLMYAKKAASRPAKRWVIGGSAAGLFICVVAGFCVAFLFSSSAFGHNSSLINGWTGVLASVLLLYVSYWLHRNSDVKRWNRFLEMKSSQALSGGRMISLGVLAFFAIVREGLETVIFLIGMAGKMSGGELAGGIAAGFGILILCAFAIMKAGARLPVRPVFLASSLIVFYLCFKFMGSGIHSLQMAGVLPAAVKDYLPEYVSISLYPSWYSTLPQLLFVCAGISMVVYQKVMAAHKEARHISQA
ncbi:FTR1 family iron permease [Paenibacillus eucommiae]|uniref:High-affinity iron transporter n=1 Tax=Paenibacillus eucommiae TaxID=1355755 RepID=A0ABS4J5L2_9BACL|nr:FTR1 family protein [Paenibacillus eucommiae]MBP1995118.1 high-affinity iron transporter [Paenibacillus eucommiae]